MGRRRDQVRLRVTRYVDGSRQVIDADPNDRAQTAEARDVEKKFCNKCFRQIGREPFHEVMGHLYHAECVKAF